jgi:SP family facilitated glucose transporter-like MFS transporter 1
LNAIESNRKDFCLFGKGFGATVGPLYITEIAPLRVRGSFGACFQLFVAIGVLLAQLLGLDICLGQKNLWNYLFGLLDHSRFSFV